MQKNNFYISFGVWLVIISLLGVPIVWRDALTALSGIFLILVSLGPSILKKLQPKQKIKKSNPVNPSSDLPSTSTSSPTLPLEAVEGSSKEI